MASGGKDFEGLQETSSWLLLRHFPKWLTRADKESLLTHFGAVEVVVMPTRGKMKHTVFAGFPNLGDATQAMGKLHQLQVFGERLVVEFARPAHHLLMQEAEKDKWSCNKTARGKPELEKEGEKVPEEVKKEAKESPRSPEQPMCYSYPAATPTVLANITSTLMCVPEFYTQVLHLMNKMDLPPPFGPLMPAPPNFASMGQLVFPTAPCRSGEEKDEEEEDEEEIQSDEEERERRRLKRKSVTQHTAKRHKMSYQQLKTIQSSLKKVSESTKESPQNPAANPQPKIELKVPSELAPPTTDMSSDVVVTYMEASKRSSPTPTPTTTTTTTTTATAGTLESAVDTTESALVVAPSEAQEQPQLFISLNQLKNNRLTETERRESHVYRNYSAGEVSSRLYIKNLAKQVEEKDLKFIFGRYINWELEAEQNMFDIRLMQTGRMKGQAFVGFPDDDTAASALADTNGYLLCGKPMVVHFARSSKPKDKT